MDMSCFCNRVTVLLTLSVVRQVSAFDEKLFENLPANEDQITVLSDEVCSNFFFDDNTDDSKIDDCIKKFSSKTRDLSSAPSKLLFICRNKNNAMYTLSPSKKLQLVTLVPDDRDMPISFTIANTSQEVNSVNFYKSNSTFWTAALNSDGTPSMWARGPSLPSSDGHEMYDVRLGEPEYQYNEGTALNVTFGVIFFGVLTPCTKVDVTNVCNKKDLGDIFETSITMDHLYQEQFKLKKPYHKNTNIVKKIVVKEVPLDDNCTLTLWRDDLVLLELKYSSPFTQSDVTLRHKFKQDLQARGAGPIAVKDLQLRAEATQNGWTVKVKWIPPKYKPEKYIVTFRTHNLTRNVEISGDATHWHFANITGDNMVTYNVSVRSMAFDDDVVVSQWALFPEPEIAKNIFLEAEPTRIGWDIYVKWNSPKIFPTKYNVTLLAPGVQRTVILPGTSTSLTLKDVMGEEMTMYNVYIAAINPRGKASTSRRAVFTSRSSYQAVIMTGSWSVGLSLAGTMVGVIVWWRRRRRKALYIRRLYMQGAECKVPEEDTDSVGGTGASSGGSGGGGGAPGGGGGADERLVHDAWEVRPERVTLREVIGEGAFGVVRRAALAHHPHSTVAVKMLKDFPTLDEIRSFRAEIELMKSVGAHPHIVSLVGCCSGRRPLIIAEYCSRGDLLNFLRCSWDVMVSKRHAKYYNNNIESSDYRNDLFKKPKDSKCAPLVVNKLYDLQGICDSELTPLDLLSFCRQIAMGMKFLASNRVVHRDLAARNVLVTADRTLKIADFGLSRDVYQENQYKQKHNGKMPVKWMALESLTHRIYSTQSDVWSFGVVVWEVVTVGGAPYPGVAAARLPKLLRSGYRMPRPNNCSQHLYEVMLSCWRGRPRERPTFGELLCKLDELLASACANQYLTLEVDDDVPPTPTHHRYIKMILRGGRVWARGENYERPLKGIQSNRYTSPPEHLKPQLV